MTATPMPVISCDANDITQQKKWYCTSFQLSLPKESSSTIDDVVGMMCHWCQYQWHQIAKKSCCTSLKLSWSKEFSVAVFVAIGIIWCQHQCKCCTSFSLSWLNKGSGATDDATGIRWWWCWCQWHHLTKNVMFISFWSSWPTNWKGKHWSPHWHGATLTQASMALHDQKSYFAPHFD